MAVVAVLERCREALGQPLAELRARRQAGAAHHLVARLPVARLLVAPLLVAWGEAPATPSPS